MYIVVSNWEAMPGKSEEFADKGKTMRAILAAQPGVEFLEGFEAEDGKFVVVIAYDSQETYDRIVNDPNGVFATKGKEHGIEEIGRWLSSQRGETIPH